MFFEGVKYEKTTPFAQLWVNKSDGRPQVRVSAEQLADGFHGR